MIIFIDDVIWDDRVCGFTLFTRVSDGSAKIIKHVKQQFWRFFIDFSVAKKLDKHVNNYFVLLYSRI